MCSDGALTSVKRVHQEEYNEMTYCYVLWGAFAKLRKATTGFVMSVRPSVCPHGTTRLQPDGFSWHLIFENFSKIYQIKASYINISQKQRVLYTSTVGFWSYLAQFFLEWEIFQTKVVEKIKTHILCSINFSPPKFVPFVRYVEKYCRAEWQHGACALHAGYLMLQTHSHNM
jgi:hypothetical protein